MTSAPSHPVVGRTTRRWVLPLLVVVVVAVAAVGGVLVYEHDQTPSATSGGSPLTTILPSAGTPSSCIVDQLGAPRPVLDLADGAYQANTYDVPNGTTGHAAMCYDASTGSEFAYANWTHVGGTGYSWFSYPTVVYGVNFWDGAYSTYTDQNPSFTLPETVASVVQQDVWFTANYSLSAPPAADVDGYDLSFDDFFTQNWPVPFEVGPFVEVETFLAHNITYPFEWVHWSAPTLVNGSLTVEPWDVAWWCHGADNSTNANVSFDFSYGGQSSHGLAAGSLGVNLSALLGEVERLMPSVTCWSGPTTGFAAFHLDQSNLGSEDGARAGSSFNYNWTVTQYCIHTVDGTPTGAGLTCSASTSLSDLRPDPGGPTDVWVAALRDRRP